MSTCNIQVRDIEDFFIENFARLQILYKTPKCLDLDLVIMYVVDDKEEGVRGVKETEKNLKKRLIWTLSLSREISSLFISPFRFLNYQFNTIKINSPLFRQLSGQPSIMKKAIGDSSQKAFPILNYFLRMNKFCKSKGKCLKIDLLHTVFKFRLQRVSDARL